MKVDILLERSGQYSLSELTTYFAPVVQAAYSGEAGAFLAGLKAFL
jgi:hypothetical protein